MPGETWTDGESWDGGALWDAPGVEPPVPPPVAITAYSELKTAIAQWLKRSDLSSQVEDFIGNCEADFNRRLRTLQGEVHTTLSISTASTSFPEGWRGWKSLVLDVNPNRVLNYLSVQDFFETFTGRTGAPTHYTMTSDQVWWGPVPNGTYSVKADYYKAWVPLSNAAPTNSMLVRHPDLYLYGSLCQAEAYLQNDERLAVWMARYEQILKQVMDEDKRDRVTGTALRGSGSAYREGLR